MIKRIIHTAVLAGVVAGLVHALLHLAFLTPLLRLAETVEHATHAHTDPSPLIIWQGHALTLGLSVALFIGYGLIMAALMGLAHTRHDIRLTPPLGIAWGVAGFASVHIAPVFILPLAVPGMAEAGLSVVTRQLIWLVVAISTGLGAWWLAFGRHAIARLSACLLVVILLVAAWLLGGTTLPLDPGPLSPHLASLFAGRSIAIAFIAWLVLGVAVARWLVPNQPR